MDWVGSDHVGTPTEADATIGEACFLCVVSVQVVIRKANSEAGSLELRVRVQLSVKNSHGNFVVEEELEVGL
jgi:hypothetical protein